MLSTVRDPGRQWERFGALDPYYGVRSEDDFRQENLDAAALERFFASGEAHVEQVLRSVRELVDPGFSPRRVLDHGCGVGRLVVPFATRASRVVGVDISSSMLAEARRNCEARGLANVELLTAGRLGVLSPEFDLVHSFIVLQHVPAREGEKIFAALARLVAPGGVGVVHVPIGTRSRRTRVHSWVTRSVPYAANLANLRHGRPWSYPHMEMNVYRLNSLLLALAHQGIDDVHLRLHAGAPGALGYASAMLVFARPAALR